MGAVTSQEQSRELPNPEDTKKDALLGEPLADDKAGGSHLCSVYVVIICAVSVLCSIMLCTVYCL